MNAMCHARSGACLLGFVLVLSVMMIGCASKPELTRTGFLSDYTMLEPVSDSRMRYDSGLMRTYRAFIVDPVQVRIETDRLEPEERAEIARHFQQEIIRAIRSAGYTTTSVPDTDVARVRVALTGIAHSSWWQKIHPVSRAAGAGTGGAAMEGEVIDSITGEQLGAVIQAGSGNQFDPTAFKTVDDVKSAITGWADIFAARLRELQARS
ncbi:MAG: DUF3313 domain-containing protein [Phycisphaerales bacterium]